MLESKAVSAPTTGSPPCPECDEVIVTVGEGTRFQRQVRKMCPHEQEAWEKRRAQEEREVRERDRLHKIMLCQQEYQRRAGPPKRHQGLRLAGIDDRECSLPGKTVGVAYIGSINENLASGKGLTLVGDVGTGKTMVAVAIANEAASLGISARFLTVTDLQGRMRDFPSAPETMRDLKRSGVLVLDDFGQERVSEWAASVLFDLIDSRYQAKLSTIFTTNFGASQLRAHYLRALTCGNDQMPADEAAITVDRILSRIRETNTHVIFAGPDQRAGADHPCPNP